MRAARRLLPLAAVWLLATMAEAQTKNCVRNCLALYTNEPASVRREVKPKCRAACKVCMGLLWVTDSRAMELPALSKPSPFLPTSSSFACPLLSFSTPRPPQTQAMRLERGMCLKEVNAVFKTASKNCTASLKGIKKGQAPLSVHLFVGDSQDGEVEDQYATYFYEKNCKASVKFLWKDYKVRTYEGLLCILSMQQKLTSLQSPVLQTADHLQRDPVPPGAVLEHGAAIVHRQPQRRAAVRWHHDGGPADPHADPRRRPRV